ncbi:unnamed protein product [Hymenolepis diminuta]|uniref:Uncharacterized protein n=1 Tax=Hymenolepis diminuta TaxID=6216 RepID=A0A3P7BMF9_HYMDI|nr:unnamed protein product [Hymenolepis diminuta]
MESEITDFQLGTKDSYLRICITASRLDTFTWIREGNITENNCCGIPSVAWEWNTHDESFRADLLSEFVHLDRSYLSSNIYEWKVDDFVLVEYIWEIYNSSNTPKRRQNCINLLNRIPSLGLKKPHARLLDFFRDHDILKTKLEDIVFSWTRARQELADRIQITLEDALEEHRRRNEEKTSAKRQRLACHLLAEKVQKWRKEKAELEELEFQAKEAKRAIQTRKETELRKKAEFETAERLRLEELRRSFDRQRRQDTRRLEKQAKTQIRELKIRQQEASEKATRQAEAREAHLEAIRAKSWRSYLEATVETQKESKARNSLNLSNLFEKPITTFTNEQLLHDRRTRITTALFEAGLLNTNYARNILEQVPRSRQPPLLLQVSQTAPTSRPGRRPPLYFQETDIFHVKQMSK